MAGNKEIINMQTYKRKPRWNIGLLLFGVVFVYLVITVLTYLTKDRIAVYEVREGSILKDTAYTGIALREETVIYTDQSGYVNYFTEEGQKVAYGDNVFTISSQKLKGIDSQESNEEVSLTSDDWNSILMKAQAFNESFRATDFKSARTLKEETTAILQSNTAQNRVTQLNSLITDGTAEGMQVYQTSEDGIIEYSIDGYESLGLNDITDEMLSKIDYTKTELTNNIKINSGDPVYRLITNEEWTLVIKLTGEMEDTLREKMGDKDFLNVKVRFTKDNERMKGSLQIYNRGKEDAYGYITFYNSMIRYAQDRYLDIELILEDESGLKIPKSSVTEKEFYVVPEDYLTTGGSSNETGVLRQTTNKKGDSITEFLSVNVFYRDNENGTVYLDPTIFEKGDILLMPESTETLTLDTTDSLKGVFNVNKGYAVFKQVEILCESEEYYIIKEGNSYGLSNYDRIALDGNSVHENDIVNQ